jgi:hypothetical protein
MSPAFTITDGFSSSPSPLFLFLSSHSILQAPIVLHIPIPAHNPGLRTPLLQVVEVQSGAPKKATFAHEPPEGSAAEQSPTVSALGTSPDASQFATARMCAVTNSVNSRITTSHSTTSGNIVLIRYHGRSLGRGSHQGML